MLQAATPGSPTPRRRARSRTRTICRGRGWRGSGVRWPTQVIEAVQGRLQAQPRPGVEVSLAGQAIGGNGSLSGAGSAEPEGADARVAGRAEKRSRAGGDVELVAGRDRGGRQAGRVPVARGDGTRPADRDVVLADERRPGVGRRRGRGGCRRLRLAVGPGRDLSLRGARGRPHARRRGDECHARGGLDAATPDRGPGQVPGPPGCWCRIRAATAATGVRERARSRAR